MLFVSMNSSLEKIFVKFPAIVNLSCCVILNFAYVGFNVIWEDFCGSALEAAHKSRK